MEKVNIRLSHIYNNEKLINYYEGDYSNEFNNILIEFIDNEQFFNRIIYMLEDNHVCIMRDKEDISSVYDYSEGELLLGTYVMKDKTLGIPINCSKLVTNEKSVSIIYNIDGDDEIHYLDIDIDYLK